MENAHWPCQCCSALVGIDYAQAVVLGEVLKVQRTTPCTPPKASAASLISSVSLSSRISGDRRSRVGCAARLSSLMSSRCGASPPVDGFCVGGHAVEQAGDEFGVSAAASGEARSAASRACFATQRLMPPAIKAPISTPTRPKAAVV